MTQIVALVPMRHQSARVPGKNYRPLAGKPLYQHIIATLLACPEIDQVVVDTDSPRIAQGLQEAYPQVRVLERPEHLRADTVPMNEVLAYDTAQVPADFYLQTHSTNPLLRAATISRAIRTLLDDYPAYDSLFSVTRLANPLVGPARARHQPQSGRPAAHPGSPAGVRREFLHLHLHPGDPAGAPQPDWRAPLPV